MSGEGIIPSDPDIPFGRWHSGRNPRGHTQPHENTRDVRLPHRSVLPGEGGGGDRATPASSSSEAEQSRHLESTPASLAGAGR